MYRAHDEIDEARTWVATMCHDGCVRRTLKRGLDYAEALERAGLPIAITSADELYEFLSDPGVATAKFQTFVPPTL